MVQGDERMVAQGRGEQQTAGGCDRHAESASVDRALSKLVERTLELSTGELDLEV